jgi:hypothetical protein
MIAGHSPEEYRIITAPSELADLRAARLPQPFRPPESWRDERFDWSSGTERVLRSTHTFPGRALFGFGENVLTLGPPQGDRTSIVFAGTRYDPNPDSVATRGHILSVGPVRCIEHVLALSAGLGIRFDCSVSRPNIPSFPSLMGPLLNPQQPYQLAPHPRSMCAVSAPFGIVFTRRGSSIIFDPPADATLTIDHHTAFKDHSLGQDRIEVAVEPPVMGYLLKARTIAYGWRSSTLRMLERLKLTRAVGLGIRGEDILMTTRSRLVNPNPAFVSEGRNREAICHGVIDKLGALALLRSFLVGRVTTDRTSHREDLIAVKLLQDRVKEVKP